MEMKPISQFKRNNWFVMNLQWLSLQVVWMFKIFYSYNVKAIYILYIEIDIYYACCFNGDLGAFRIFECQLNLITHGWAQVHQLLQSLYSDEREGILYQGNTYIMIILSCLDVSTVCFSWAQIVLPYSLRLLL